MAYIDIKNLSKTYTINDTEKVVLKDININIDKGEFLCIMGSSGSGKSTLIKMIGGILTPTSGEIVFNGKCINRYSSKELDIYRQNNTGYVFQDFNLLEGLTIKENIILPLTILDIGITNIEKKYNKVKCYIDLTHCENNYPEKTSGGEQQRASICRALIKEPDILLADEPTGNLDNKNINTVLYSLKEINQKLGTTIIMVTHDEMVASYSDRVIFIENGKIHKSIYKLEDTQNFYNAIIEETTKIRGIL
ncbi:ABC transporter ATP-binding protein [Paeniclostridium sordellii]|uniref:ABC transporter ATP-binding protein n=1 Tax=Paraclostridium sordellii TaxID=1505 RepID=UPI00214A84D9|nr:ABC transporter ATP-binding protein [Paeniclostridium sordellii]MCR1848941.1 ABC transporter ATP-binding protein [Paeniclostridium sordellii]